MNKPGKNLLYYIVAAICCGFAVILFSHHYIGAAVLLCIMTFGTKHIIQIDKDTPRNKAQIVSIVIVILSNFIYEIRLACSMLIGQSSFMLFGTLDILKDMGTLLIGYLITCTIALNVSSLILSLNNKDDDD